MQAQIVRQLPGAEQVLGTQQVMPILAAQVAQIGSIMEPIMQAFRQQAPELRWQMIQGPVQNSQITNEQFTISYRVTANNTTPAGTYKNTILYTIVPSY